MCIMNKPDGTFDYSKFFMGLAVAIVFVLQQYHAMQLDDVRSSVVPRAEYEKHRDSTMDKDEILKALQMVNARLNSMEGSSDD